MKKSVERRLLEGARLPHRLRDLPDPPARLHLRGELPAGPWAAVVGSRLASADAAAYARELAAELARAGVVVASGGALGIDAAAHRGALDAGGPTVVVAPSGWDRPYPLAHRALFETIVRSGGAHLSSFDEQVQPQRPQFFRRNALLSALCHVLVVVEAGLRSGALNAAKKARELGRPVLVAPTPPWQPRGAGCTAELLRGALPLRSASSVFEALEAQGLRLVSRGSPAPDAERAAPDAAASAARQGSPSARILAALAGGPRHADELCRDTGLSAAELGHAALLLTLEGRVSRGDDGRLTRSGR